MVVDARKGDVSGFAKLQQILPNGFSAEAGESANATFSFKDQKVKFLWMALPNDDFTVSYKVNVDGSLSGNQIVEGTQHNSKRNEYSLSKYKYDSKGNIIEEIREVNQNYIRYHDLQVTPVVFANIDLMNNPLASNELSFLKNSLQIRNSLSHLKRRRSFLQFQLLIPVKKSRISI